jgi:DNA-directed RNA polymerases I, II, and III subunit RPABC3
MEPLWTMKIFVGGGCSLVHLGAGVYPLAHKKIPFWFRAHNPADPHYLPNQGGDQKRQKTFDFAEDDNIYLANLQTVDITSFPHGPNDTPGFIQRRLTRAYSYTPLELGHKLRGYSYHGSPEFSDLYSRSTPRYNWIVFEDWQRSDIYRNPIDFFTPAPHDVFFHIPGPKFGQLQPKINMASAGDSTLFDESFTITNIDSAKYDRVSRLAATSGDSQTVMTLDINSELYPCSTGETVHCVLASSLALDGSKDDKGWRDVAHGEASLADMFDYVCHGKIYKFEDAEDGQTM